MTDIRSQLTLLVPRLRRFAYMLTGNSADGDDLLQTTIERVLVKQDSYDARLPLLNWCYTLCRNLWVDELRARARRGMTVDVDEQFDLSDPASQESQERQMQMQEVIKAMSELPEAQHWVAYYVLIEGYSYQDVAETLDIPVGTVMSRLARARHSLSQSLQA